MIPLWVPFAFLAGVCAVYPRPKWVRRVDWLAVTWLVCFLCFCAVVWIGVVRITEWAIS